MLLDMPKIHIKRSTIINLATLLHTYDDGEQHNCIAILEQVCTPRPDLKQTQIDNPDLALFVDGSAFRDPTTARNQVGFAVVSFCDTLCSGSLPSHYSAPTAELIELTEACILAEGKI